MSNDLLFSILPREGKVAIKHDTQKVEKIEKTPKMKPLSDEEQELIVDEREARQNNSHQQSDKPNGEQNENSAQQSSEDIEQDNTSKTPKGPKHINFYV